MSKMSTSQTTLVRALIIVTVLVTVAAVAVVVYKSTRVDDNSGVNDSTQSQSVENLPEIKKSADLDDAQKAVENVNPDSLGITELDEVLQ